MAAFLNPIQPFFLVNTSKYFKIQVPDTPIVHFYSFTATAGDIPHNVVIPDGCVDIMLNEYNGQINANICGMVTKGNTISIENGHRYFGVRFLPGYIPKDFNVDIPELVNNTISLSDLTHGNQLLDKITATEDFTERAKLILSFIDEKWATNQLLQQIIKIIREAKGEIRVKDIEEKTLYSGRYINKIFRENLGLSAKEFCEHIRFQHIISFMNTNNYNKITDIAVDYGFYDQSHFTREFNKFTTVNPGSYREAVDLPHYHNKFVYYTV